MYWGKKLEIFMLRSFKIQFSSRFSSDLEIIKQKYKRYLTAHIFCQTKKKKRKRNQIQIPSNTIQRRGMIHRQMTDGSIDRQTGGRRADTQKDRQTDR